MKVIKFAPGLVPVLKHGNHDQSSHGNWATGGSSWVNAPSHGKEITETAYRGVVLEATKNSKEPTNEEILKTLENRWARGEKPGEVLGQYWSSNEKVALDSSTGDNSQSFWWSQSGVLGQLQPEVIYGVVFEAGIHRPKRDTTNPFYLPNEKGVDAPTLDNIVSLKGKLIKRTKTDFLYEPKIETVREFDIPYDVKILSPKSLSVTKHGNHDQRSHGTWAHGGGDNALNNFNKAVDDAYGTGDDAFTLAHTGDESVAAMGSYLAQGHQINDSIRAGGADSADFGDSINGKPMAQIVAGIDNAIEMAPPIPNQKVWRTTSAYAIQSLKKNGVYLDKGFTSTTAADITHPDNGKLLLTLATVSHGQKAIMEIDTGSFGKGIYIPKMFPGQPIAEMEKEFLMPRNTKMKYLGPDYIFAGADKMLEIHKFKVVN